MEDLVVAEVEPELDDLGEESGFSGNFPDGSHHFEERVERHYCIRSHYESVLSNLTQSVSLVENIWLFGYSESAGKSNQKQIPIVCLFFIFWSNNCFLDLEDELKLKVSTLKEISKTEPNSAINLKKKSNFFRNFELHCIFSATKQTERNLGRKLEVRVKLVPEGVEVVPAGGVGGGTRGGEHEDEGSEGGAEGGESEDEDEVVEAPQLPERDGGVEGIVAAVAVRLRRAHGGCVGVDLPGCWCCWRRRV
ncbi:hypothetical protein ACFX15_001230 [Malus domestica]